MTHKLVAAQLIEQAQADTALEHFDSDSFREGLDIFLSDFNNTGAPEAALERTPG